MGRDCRATIQRMPLGEAYGHRAYASVSTPMLRNVAAQYVNPSVVGVKSEGWFLRRIQVRNYSERAVSDVPCICGDFRAWRRR